MHLASGHYDAEFYSQQSGSSHEAALRILPLVFQVVGPSSVVDVGCGVGSWLAAAGALGVRRLVGLEGDWVKEEELMDPSIQLLRGDLEKPLECRETFDLAMSLEVAEHLSPDRAESFVEELCRLAPCVLFGAAIPGQGGLNHVNERWQEYWAELFASNGYRPLDLIRPQVWADRTLPIHYRQNPFLFAAPGRYEELVQAAGEKLLPAPWPRNMVHPELHMNNLAGAAEPPTLPQALGIAVRLPLFAWRSVQVRLNRGLGGS